MEKVLTKSEFMHKVINDHYKRKHREAVEKNEFYSRVRDSQRQNNKCFQRAK